MTPVRVAGIQIRRIEAQLAAAETAPGSAGPAEATEQAERAKAEAPAKLAELQVQLAAAKAELQPKLDAVATARAPSSSQRPSGSRQSRRRARWHANSSRCRC